MLLERFCFVFYRSLHTGLHQDPDFEIKFTLEIYIKPRSSLHFLDCRNLNQVQTRNEFDIWGRKWAVCSVQGPSGAACLGAWPGGLGVKKQKVRISSTRSGAER